MSDAGPPVLPRVLIVDDSRMVRASITKHIRDRFDVREESDGEAGWQTLMLDPDVQVLICDLSMPKLDGYGLLRRIRDSEVARIREMPVIMISGDEDESARKRAKECGATDFITKGIGTVELLSRLEALVRLSRTARELEASREAVAQNVMVDPESGLATEQYLKRQGRQALSMAQRHGGEISVVVIEIARFGELVGKYGQAAGEQLIRQFRTFLSARLRSEDTVSQTGASGFTLVCPGISLDECRGLATRLNTVIRGATIRYRGEPISIELKFGFANSREDDWQSMTSLLDLAGGRTGEGDELVPRREPAAGSGKAPERPIGIEEALALLEAGAPDKIRPHAALLARRLLPLLQLLDAEYRLGLRLEEMERAIGRP